LNILNFPFIDDSLFPRLSSIMSDMSKTPTSDSSDDLESTNSPLDKDGSSGARNRNQDLSGGHDEELKAPVEIGDLVDGRFKIRQVLGQGGFGAVFEVLDYKSKRPAALKVIIKFIFNLFRWLLVNFQAKPNPVLFSILYYSDYCFYLTRSVFLV